jgi:hypothetical protein
VLQYGKTAAHIWQWYDNMPVESTWPDKRLVECFGEIRSADEYYAFCLRKSVQLDKQFVESFQGHLSADFHES